MQTIIMESGLIHFSPDGEHTVRVRVRHGIMHRLPSVKSVVTHTRTFSRRSIPMIPMLGQKESGLWIIKASGNTRIKKRYSVILSGVQVWMQDLETSTTYLGWKVSKLQVGTWRSTSSK